VAYQSFTAFYFLRSAKYVSQSSGKKALYRYFQTTVEKNKAAKSQNGVNKKQNIINKRQGFRSSSAQSLASTNTSGYKIT